MRLGSDPISSGVVISEEGPPPLASAIPLVVGDCYPLPNTVVGTLSSLPSNAPSFIPTEKGVHLTSMDTQD